MLFFYGWKFEPILKEIRIAYRDLAFYDGVPDDVIARILRVMNKVFEEYSAKDSWSLSRLTHGELSWKKSRVGIADGVNGDNPIHLEDIREDANRIRQRRAMLSQYTFVSKRGSSLVNYFKEFGLKEEKSGKTAYYVIKTRQNEMLMFFSMKCGALFDALLDEDEMQKDCQRLTDSITGNGKCGWYRF